MRRRREGRPRHVVRKAAGPRRAPLLRRQRRGVLRARRGHPLRRRRRRRRRRHARDARLLLVREVLLLQLQKAAGGARDGDPDAGATNADGSHGRRLRSTRTSGASGRLFTGEEHGRLMYTLRDDDDDERSGDLRREAPDL